MKIKELFAGIIGVILSIAMLVALFNIYILFNAKAEIRGQIAQLEVRLERLDDVVNSLADTIDYIYNKEKSIRYFNIPLSYEKQAYATRIARTFDICPAFIFAIIEQESNFNPYAQRGRFKGLMQIDPHWKGVFGNYDDWNLHYWRDNILLGVLILDYYVRLGYEPNSHALLMAYNQNDGGARSLMSRGIHETPYSRSVLNIHNRLQSNNI